MDDDDLQKLYQSVGGHFETPIEVLRGKMQKIRCLMFDWDGVFNDGIKGATALTNFAEADTMGINLLRYSLFLLHGQKQMPYQVIITGQQNESARRIAVRDRFQSVYERALDKSRSFLHATKQLGLHPEEVAFFYDDVLDLPIAALCGVRVMIRRNASPLFNRYVTDNGYADYLTGAQPRDHALREATEMLSALVAPLNQIFEDRWRFSERYRCYWQVRQQVAPPLFWEEKEERIEQINLIEQI